MVDCTTTKIAISGCDLKLMRGGSGPPLLVLHGASGTGPWQEYLKRLAARFDVIVAGASGFRRHRDAGVAR